MQLHLCVCYSFIIAVDYFQARYPGTTVIFDMSIVYIIMAFFAVFANNILVETLSLNTRITFGKTSWSSDIGVDVTWRYAHAYTHTRARAQQYDLRTSVLNFFIIFVRQNFIIKIVVILVLAWVQFKTIW